MGTPIPNEVLIIMPSKHATCSPSSFKRWSNCPASAKQQQMFQSNPSYAAVEGTVCHEIGEMELKEAIQGMSMQDYWLGREVEQEGIKVKVTQELIDIANIYVDYVKARKIELNATLLIEEQVEMAELHEAVWGTSDTLLIADKKIDNIIEVCDFKAGKWPVPVENNPQLKIYGLGALSRYGDEETTVRMTIVQPRSPGKNKPKINSVDMSSEALVDWGYSVLKPSAEACFEDNPPFKAGDWCRFCAYKEHCDEFKNAELRSKA